MAAARRVAEADKFARAREFKTWHLKMLLGHDVYGKTLGIIGFGRIGQSVARRARGFDMRIQYYDPQPPPESVGQALGASPTSLDAILRTSDYISIHVPLLPDTHHLIDDAALASMKPNAILVNTSRGPVVHEKALVRALKSGRIAAAGLDVFENEPLIEPELLELDNVVLAPHIASASHETRLRMCMLAAENLVAGLKGQRPPNLVNPEVWERRRPSTFVPFSS
jgi:glyoxylate reductase